MPEPHDVVFFESAAQLRKWFEANHETAAELWVGYHLKKTGRASITWRELVDQELCFGWIDSVRYSLGDGRSAQRVTPRRKRSVWSAVNIRRFQELDTMGVVHPSGHRAFAARDESRSAIYSYENSSVLDEEMKARFQRSKTAWSFFSEQAPWYRRTAAHWVVSAKRDETRDRRLGTLIECSRKGERLPHLSRP